MKNKFVKNYSEFIQNEAFSLKIIDILIGKYKLENTNLTDSQFVYYINKFDELKNSPKIIEKDIFKYSFKDLEKLIDSFSKKVNKSEINNIDSNDILYNENNLLILKGDTKEKCIKYGKAYEWCISRNNSSNMFNSYRYDYESNEMTFYFIFDNDLNDDNKAIVLSVDKNNKYTIANISNKGDFDGTKKITFEEICKFQPKIKKLSDLFKSLPLTQKEKDINKQINEKINEDNLLDFLGSYQLLDLYISYGHLLSDNQYINLDSKLKNKYINLHHQLSYTQLKNTPNKLKERHDYLHSIAYWLDGRYNKEEQYNLTKIDCSHSNLTNLKGIENMPNLKFLNCFGSYLTSLEGIENMPNLICLNLTCNYLTSLEGIENLTELIDIDFSYNNLTSLKGVEKLTKLQKINCSYNKELTSLKSIQGLSNLIELNCIKTGLKITDSDKILNMIKKGEDLKNIEY